MSPIGPETVGPVLTLAPVEQHRQIVLRLLSSVTSATCFARKGDSVIRQAFEQRSMNGPSMLHPQVGDTEYHNDLPHSYFPCLDPRPGQNGAWQSTEVPFKDVLRLQSFCREHNVSCLSLFQAAWALVLRCYLGSPSVCFASDSSDMAEDANGTTVSVCRIAFSETSSILDILKGLYTKCFPSSSEPSLQSSVHAQPDVLDSLPMNTSLVYREDNRSMLHRPANAEYTLRGLKSVCNGSFLGEVSGLTR